MNENSISKDIRKKVKQLMAERGIKKTKLGEILGEGKVRTHESPQQKYLRADRFLSSASDIGLDTLIRLLKFFEKPIDYFLDMTRADSFILCASEKTKITPPKSLSQIETGLKKLKVDKKIISAEMTKLKAAATPILRLKK